MLFLSSMPFKHMDFMSSRNGTIQLKLRDVPQIKDFLLIIVLLDIAMPAASMNCEGMNGCWNHNTDISNC